jgi:Ribulose-5-phosphate 4-epimerase and related epimerases and aldolases
VYLERFIHGEIYRVRPDVRAVVHNHSPSVIPFGVTGAPLRPLYHMSAFLWPGVPVFEIRSAGGPATDMLIRDAALGQALARSLGAGPVALMRGHGAVGGGSERTRGGLPQRLHRGERASAGAGDGPRRTVTYLDPEEAKRAQASIGGTIGRPWELWKKKASAR